MNSFILLCLFFQYCFSITSFHLQDTNTSIYFDSVSLGYPITFWNIDLPVNLSGNLIASNPRNGCSKLIGENYNGNILLVMGESCSLEDKFKNVQKVGGIGILIISQDDYIGRIRYTFKHTTYHKNEITIQGLEIPKNSSFLFEYLEKGNKCIIEGESQYNPWFYYISNNYWIFYSIVITLSNIYLIIMSICRIIQYYKSNTSLLPIINYTCILIGSILRFTWGVDPSGGFRIHNYSAVTLLLSMSTPWTFASTIFIGFFWLEVLTKKNLHSKPIQKLERYRIPCILFIFITFLFEIITSSLRAIMLPIESLSFILAVLYFILTFIILIFFTINCKLLYKHLPFENVSSETISRGGDEIADKITTISSSSGSSSSLSCYTPTVTITDSVTPTNSPNTLSNSPSKLSPIIIAIKNQTKLNTCHHKKRKTKILNRLFFFGISQLVLFSLFLLFTICIAGGLQNTPIGWTILRSLSNIIVTLICFCQCFLFTNPKKQSMGNSFSNSTSSKEVSNKKKNSMPMKEINQEITTKKQEEEGEC